jgi:hypothetical protein
VLHARLADVRSLSINLRNGSDGVFFNSWSSTYDAERIVAVHRLLIRASCSSAGSGIAEASEVVVAWARTIAARRAESLGMVVGLFVIFYWSNERYIYEVMSVSGDAKGVVGIV